MMSPGIIRTRGARHRKSGRRHPTSWVSMICLETCGSGAVTGLETTPVRHRQTRIITVVPSGFFVAAAGTTMRRTHVWLIAATTRLLARTTTSASVLQGRCPDYTLAFLHFYTLLRLRAPGRGLVPQGRKKTQHISEVLWPSG